MYGDTGEQPPSRGPVDDDLAVGMEYDVTTKYESSDGSKEHAVRQFLARHPLGVNVGSLLTQISSATITTMTAPVQIHGGGPSGPSGGGGPPGGAGGPNPPAGGGRPSNPPGGAANVPQPQAPVNRLQGNPPSPINGEKE